MNFVLQSELESRASVGQCESVGQSVTSVTQSEGGCDSVTHSVTSASHSVTTASLHSVVESDSEAGMVLLHSTVLHSYCQKRCPVYELVQLVVGRVCEMLVCRRRSPPPAPPSPAATTTPRTR